MKFKTGSSGVTPHCQRPFFLQNCEPAFVKGKPERLYTQATTFSVWKKQTLWGMEKQEIVILSSKQIIINTCISTQKTFHPTCLIESLASLNIGMYATSLKKVES